MAIPSASTQLVITAEGTTAGSPEAHAAILQDLRNIANAIAQNQPGVSQPASYAGGSSVNLPTAGMGKIFATCNTTVAQSSASYYTLTGLVNGAARSGGVSVSTQAQTITAYQPLYLGTMPVSKSSMVEIQVTPTGMPATTITSANFSLRVDLSPQATS